MRDCIRSLYCFTVCHSCYYTAQSSADNAEAVGLMAEGMANKAWHFAQSAAPTATPPKGRRSYSTTAAPPTTGMLLYYNCKLRFWGLIIENINFRYYLVDYCKSTKILY